MLLSASWMAWMIGGSLFKNCRYTIYNANPGQIISLSFLVVAGDE
jgi:hypothetical protein